jgi:hypothetical protein
MLGEYLAKARELLEDHLYLETVKVLETCESKGFSSPEMSDLLNMARSAAAERVSQDLVERSFLEAKRLLEEQRYEAVLKLLPPVLQRVDEPALRRLLDEATQKQRMLEQQVDQVIAAVRRYCEMELFDAAIGLINAEPAGVRQVERVKSALENSQKMLDDEASRVDAIGGVYAILEGPECAMAFQRIASAEATAKKSAGVAEVEQRLGVRVRMTIDHHVMKSVEAARQALRSEQPALAHDLLENVAAWQTGSTPAVQEQWRSVQMEITTAKKVLRFRNVLRR